jgi:fimbrial isopeptide formation D2 family protein
MFKKIVSQLSFSPALVGQLSFYAKRLRKEQVTRRLGVVFVALALVVQGLTLFQAPEAANASNNNDFVIGGLGTGSQRDFNRFLGPYDRNERNLQDVFNYFGITRQEITSMRFEQFTIGDKKSYGFENRAGSTTIPITNANWQTVTTIYGRTLTSFGNSPQGKTWAYVGHSSKIGWFAILQTCGNLVTDHYPQAPTPPPAPANIVASKTAINSTQNIDASKASAKAGDRVTYTIKASNTGGTAKAVDLNDNISEVLKYGRLVDTGGGSLNTNTGVLSWQAANLGPGASVQHSYTVQMNSSLISTEENCRMRNNFMDQIITVPVGCTTPPAKLEFTKTALNTTQGNVDATKVTAKEKDRLTFTLTVKNSGGTPKEVVLEDNIGDALEYAKLIDTGGGTYQQSSRNLVWPTIVLKAGETQVRTFTMQVLDTIPATPQGVSDPSSYDCRIENAFYTASVVIPVTCTTPPKVVEQVVSELPTTGPRENMLFAGILLAVVVFFYFRAKQLNTEVRLIRRDVNGGTF